MLLYNHKCSIMTVKLPSNFLLLIISVSQIQDVCNDHQFGDIRKIRSLKISEFDPPSPPLFALLRFRFWLELTLSPSISVLVKFRENKLIMSTSIIG